MKLPGADGKPVYAQWIPAGDGGPAPVLLIASPYDGINWSGEAVDNALTADGGCMSCLLPDTYGPNTFPDAGEIYYAHELPRAMAEAAGIYQLNGISVLYVFGRHYAGASFFQQSQAMAAGLRFLAQRPDVDRTRIGMVGGSLGGFEVLAGAAFAPDAARPKVVLAVSPLNDLPQWLEFIKEDLPLLLGTDARRAEFARSHVTFSRVFLVNSLSVQPRVQVEYSAESMRAFFTRVRDLSRAGFPQFRVVPRLIELAGPRVQMYELTTQTFTAGATIVSVELDVVFGVNTFTAANVVTELEANGLPP